MTYKAKILKVNNDFTYSVTVPSIGVTEIKAYLVGQKNQTPGLMENDLVLVTETNDQSWVILGYIYSQKVEGNI